MKKATKGAKKMQKVMPSETSLSIDMSIRSSQGLLSRMGHPGLLRDTPGEVKGRLAWDGSPTDYKLSRLRGQLSLDLLS